MDRIGRYDDNYYRPIGKYKNTVSVSAEMSQYDIGMAGGWIAFDQEHSECVDGTPPRIDQKQELAFLGSVGTLVENFAKNLDDFIGHALDEWSSPSPNSNKHREACDGGVPGYRIDTSATEKQECTSATKSWNDSFSDDEEDSGWIGTKVMSPQPGGGDHHHAFDLLHERKEHVRHVLEKNPLERYRKQNTWLKSKVLALEKHIAAMEKEEMERTQPRDQSCSLQEEHVTLQMQIEQLLSHKSRLVYENDSLKRENARLNELIEYFFASTNMHGGAEEEDGSDVLEDQSQ